MLIIALTILALISMFVLYSCESDADSDETNDYVADMRSG